ncbi:protein kinase activating protein dpb11 [Entomophthora muscae]|uniref:Protein kinase activating protein dpb11 n=1 Tax=Entomophthora muscae TaxID=34485 RepID=A0ACC2TSM6_9FUNG|nr:protein kinase activating protein dpb11 [Entomophthora muscae]
MSDQKSQRSKPFDGFLFCFTGIKFDYREELSNNVRQLGGAVSKSYKGAVTHLIAKSKTSEKFEAAVKLNVPILLPSFVKDCFTSYKNNLPINMEKLILRLFFLPTPE